MAATARECLGCGLDCCYRGLLGLMRTVHGHEKAPRSDWNEGLFVVGAIRSRVRSRTLLPLLHLVGRTLVRTLHIWRWWLVSCWFLSFLGVVTSPCRTILVGGWLTTSVVVVYALVIITKPCRAKMERPPCDVDLVDVSVRICATAVVTVRLVVVCVCHEMNRTAWV